MHVWSPIPNSAVDLICGPLRPCVFNAQLELQDPPGNPRPITGAPAANGTITFQISAADVQLLKTSATARLLLTTQHTLIPGSPDPRWGWRYTIAHAPGQLTVTEAGAAIALDPQGYFDTPLQNYPAPPVVLTNKVVVFQ